jgi:SRSO17 transposase
VSSETVLGTNSIAISDTISDFCRQAFVSLPRSDQRRWGELYVRGLVTIPGRKTVRRIAELAGHPSADQSLQQFVNQSPWDWAPVRSEVGRLLAASSPVEAWIAAEVAFPKNGDSSVGVGTQYVGPAARTLHCQLALALFLSGDQFCCPVNWRLMLPKTWDEDPHRRRRSHLPADERHRPCWQHMLDVLDETVAWGLPPRPVLADRRHDPAVQHLLRGLQERGLPYLVRVGDEHPVTVAGRPVRAADAQRAPLRERLSLVTPGAAGGRAVSSHFVAIPLSTAGLRPARPARARHDPWLVSRRPGGGGRPTGLWLTNLDHDLGKVVRMTRLLDQHRRQHAEFERGSGLHHFEGRSFRGWHHHVTLTSAAYAYRLLTSVPGPVPAPRYALG